MDQPQHLDILLVVVVEVDQHTLMEHLLLKDLAVVEEVQIMDIHLGVGVLDQHPHHMETGVVLLVQPVKDLLQVEVVEV